MKKITELSKSQILALTTDQLELMVKYAMAEAGIKILALPNKGELKELPAKDESCYTVEGIKFNFYQKQVAEAVADVLKANASQLVYQGYNSDPNFIPFTRYNESAYEFKGVGDVKRIEYYSEKLRAEIKETVLYNNKVNADFKAAMEEYNTEFDKAKTIKDEIYGIVHSLNEKQYQMENMASRFKEYLELADGNEKVALSFLKKAYTVDSETLDFILPPKVLGTED